MTDINDNLIDLHNGSWFDPDQRVTLGPAHSRVKKLLAKRAARKDAIEQSQLKAAQSVAPIDFQNAYRQQQETEREQGRRNSARSIQQAFPAVVEEMAALEMAALKHKPEGFPGNEAEYLREALRSNPRYRELQAYAGSMKDTIGENLDALDWTQFARQTPREADGTMSWLATQAGALSGEGDSADTSIVTQLLDEMERDGTRNAPTNRMGEGRPVGGDLTRPSTPQGQQPNAPYEPREFPPLTAETREGRMQQSIRQGTFKDRIEDFRSRGGEIDAQGNVTKTPPPQSTWGIARHAPGSVAPNEYRPGQAGPNPGRGLSPLERGFVKDENGNWNPGSNIGGVPSFAVMQQLERNAARPAPDLGDINRNGPTFGTYQTADGGWTGMGATDNQGGFATEDAAREWSMANFSPTGEGQPIQHFAPPPAVASGNPEQTGANRGLLASEESFRPLPGFQEGAGIQWLARLRQGIQDRRQNNFSGYQARQEDPDPEMGGWREGPPVSGGGLIGRGLQWLRRSQPQDQQPEDPSRAPPSWFPQGGSSVPRRSTDEGQQAPNFAGAFDSRPQQQTAREDFVTEAMREPQGQANPQQRQREPRLPALRAL